jgi:predicted transcriptional regulator of viral defense system
MQKVPTRGADNSRIPTGLRSLGPQEASIILSLIEQQHQTTDTPAVAAIVGSTAAARAAIKRLVAKGWLKRLGGRRYAVVPPEYGKDNIGDMNTLALASVAVDPGYLGWWSAAAFHGFTTQVPMVAQVATTRDRPARRINDMVIEFHRVAPEKIFGIEEALSFGRRLKISDPEKTVIDCVDRPQLCGGPAELASIVWGAARAVDQQKLTDYALKMDSVSLLQRLGFLSDIIARLPEPMRAKLRAHIPKSARSVLGAPRGTAEDIGYVKDWGLLVHVSRRNLLGNLPVGTPDSANPKTGNADPSGVEDRSGRGGA